MTEDNQQDLLSSQVKNSKKMHSAVPKYDVLVIIQFYRMSTLTKLLRIGTQLYSAYIYCRFQTVFSPQIIILNVTKIYTNRRISSKK